MCTLLILSTRGGVVMSECSIYGWKFKKIARNASLGGRLIDNSIYGQRFDPGIANERGKR